MASDQVTWVEAIIIFYLVWLVEKKRKKWNILYTYFQFCFHRITLKILFPQKIPKHAKTRFKFQRYLNKWKGLSLLNKTFKTIEKFIDMTPALNLTRYTFKEGMHLRGKKKWKSYRKHARSILILSLSYLLSFILY